ncbi:MAG: thioesterase family protein [Gammaproteobacteria bacterium]|nr:thioesterase family protein [Gammaproteobacteria bacterium]
MKEFSRTFNIRWADVDVNRHMRHSAYNDYAAHVRIQLLKEIGMDIDTLAGLNFGPVLFREETVFFREIGMNEDIKVNVKLKSARNDGSRWSFVHEFINNEGKVAATVTVDGAWIDLKKRKLTALPDECRESMFNIPRTDDFAFEPDKT